MTLPAEKRVSRTLAHVRGNPCAAAAPSFRYTVDAAEERGILTRAQREFYEPVRPSHVFVAQ